MEQTQQLDKLLDRARKVLEQLRGGLIVSCQATYSDSPANSPDFLARMAQAAVRGGARGIRANRPENIRAIRRAVEVPIIGLYKESIPGYEVYITPTFEHARLVVEAGADIVALDGTLRDRPGPEDLGAIVRRIRTELGAMVMLDISTIEEGLKAAALSPDLISTTLSGYTSYSPRLDGPDLRLVWSLAARSDIPVVAEGRIESPEQVRAAFEAGAFAAVVGRAITDPEGITRRYAAAAEKNRVQFPQDSQGQGERNNAEDV
ncbi:MAG: N-acetylmannosamine-6-phosphate 2-epimerase [Firmicutes bacterium]|nr:N-acetylmannosamine-6-phosphate 2-epimerase [Bacillota bacterium]